VTPAAEEAVLVARAGLVDALPDEAAGVQGSQLMSAAAPSVVPVQLASESASLAITRAGPRVMLAVSVNPLGYLSSGTANPSQAYPWWRRFFDVSLTVPVNTEGLLAGTSSMPSNTPALPSPWNVMEFVGVRVRMNFLAAASGSVEARAVGQRFAESAQRLGEVQSLVTEQLDAAGPEVRSAVETIFASPARAWVTAFEPLATALQALDRQRRQASRGYFGLDLRFTAGDTTFAQQSGLLAYDLLGALAGGYTSGGPGARFGFRARAGLQLHAPIAAAGGEEERIASLDGALGFMVALPRSPGGAEPLTVNVGAEGRYSPLAPQRMADAGVTNTLDLRVSVNVPLSDGSSVGLGLSLPLVGGGAGFLSLSGNLAQLLGLPSTLPRGSTAGN
jgi:hypothetical protein